MATSACLQVYLNSTQAHISLVWMDAFVPIANVQIQVWPGMLSLMSANVGRKQMTNTRKLHTAH